MADGASSGTLFDLRTPFGQDLAAVDWSATGFGAENLWPASLRNVVRLMLGSRFPMWLAWGPELTFLCNDAYRRDTLGAKYPWALGRPATEVWAEIWPDIGPRIESVITTGVATWDESLMLFLERSGYQEETYHTFSYSPVSDDDGRIVGMLCVVTEETARVVGERRVATLRDLGGALATSATEAEVHSAAATALGADNHNMPFAAVYLIDRDARTASLAWSANAPPGHDVVPPVVGIGDDPDAAHAPWPTSTVLSGRSELIEARDCSTSSPLPSGAWQDPPSHLVLSPLLRPGSEQPNGFLLVGLNPYRALDDDYSGFIDLAAGQLAAAIVRARAYEQERRRAEELAELDRAKTTFFTNVSHELRTPLTLLLGPVGDALEDTVEPLAPVQRGRVDMVRRNAERLLKLVNTLLDFSRMEAGPVAGRFEPVDIVRSTAELTAMFESAAQTAGLELTLDAAQIEQPVYVDQEMWAKIVLNLVSNALKATFTGGITVGLAPRDGELELTVTDTGTGIPAAEQRRLFERFHRVVGADLRSHEGSGIGLALVSELVGLHGGSVAVRSEVGQGSTFTVRIPFGDAHLPPDQVSQTARGPLDARRFGTGYLAETQRWLDAPRESTGPPPSTPAHGRRSVLVVDDNPDMREYVCGLLADTYAVTSAADGREALDLALADPPDLVLTDVMMPRLDGFGLLAALRESPATVHVPVVMLSARSGDEATVSGLDAGADDYLVKPFSARELVARVRANLELDRVRRVVEQLDRSRELLDNAERLARVGSWEIDLRDDAITGSTEYFAILGVAEDAFDQSGLAAALRRVVPEDRTRLETALARLRAGEGTLAEEIRVERHDGVRLLMARGVLRRDAQGLPVSIRGSLQDITDQREAELLATAATAAAEVAAREHAIAEELQRSLLPAIGFAAGRPRVAAYYAAGVEGTQAGGDWYDIIDLAGGRTALVLGDVMGRGIKAAGVTGQLRAAVRAYSRIELPPQEILELLDDAVCDIDDRTIVTCVYAVWDSTARTLTYANAGHLPPLLTAADGPTRQLTTGGPPLGTGCYGGEVETIEVPDTCTVTLYTDGLVEHRGSDLADGIARLASVVSELDAPLEAWPSLVVDELLPHVPDDDVAMLVAALGRDVDAELMLHLDPEPSVGSIGVARTLAAERCEQHGYGEPLVSTVRLLVSELVTNALKHGRPPVGCTLWAEADRVVLEVSDASVVRPEHREADEFSPGGRGLTIVAAIASSWGVRPSGRGKSVWCTVDSGPAA